MERNKRAFWYALYQKSDPILDEYGNEIGTKITYAQPVSMRANISSATGAAQVEQFGNLPDYDKVIVTDDMSCPIDETTVLFLDKEPGFNAEGVPLYDYRVKRVAASLNSISYAVSKVSVS